MTRGNTCHLHPINPEINRTYHRLVRQSRNLPFHSVPDYVSDSISDSIPVSVHSVQYTDFVHSVALSDSEHYENSVHSENMAQPPTPPGPRVQKVKCGESYHKNNKTPLCVCEYKREDNIFKNKDSWESSRDLRREMRKYHKVGGGVGGTCKVTKDQTQHSPRLHQSKSKIRIPSSQLLMPQTDHPQLFCLPTMG
ncbi:hypothetical protein Lal_00015161 [Lupinus albus]|nr:hypothetical protein Lal_00015161 [Lupinus albus]